MNMDNSNEAVLGRLLRMTFSIGFSYALESLIRETSDLDWTDVEKHYPKRVREGLKIPGTMRMIQDRFAFYFQACRLTRDVPAQAGDFYEKMRDEIFEPGSWKDWRG